MAPLWTWEGKLNRLRVNSTASRPRCAWKKFNLLISSIPVCERRLPIFENKLCRKILHKFDTQPAAPCNAQRRDYAFTGSFGKNCRAGKLRLTLQEKRKPSGAKVAGLEQTVTSVVDPAFVAIAWKPWPNGRNMTMLADREGYLTALAKSASQ